MSDKIDISQYLNAFLEETQEHLQAFTQAMIEFEDADGECAAEVLNTAFRAAHTVKGMSASMDFMNMERLCHSMEDLLDELRSGSHSVTPELIDLLLECSTKLEELTIYIEENGTDDIDVSEVLSELDKVKVNGEGERAKDKRGKAKKAEKKEDLSSKLEKSKVKGKEAAVKSVRISIDKLDTVGNLVGELVINKSRLIQIGREHEIEELSSTMAVVERTISDLQYAVTQMRMIPVEHVFNRFPKLVRDLYRAQGKEVDFIVKGKEIELDRTILDEIVDPIVHLLRNSVDHGIELPEVREEAGKERIGRITLAAKRETGHVTICVEDDGKGMDPRILRDKAVSKGLLSADEVAKLSDDDAFKLIFMPGFSTAEKTTAVSGRGVGMEVVKTKIEALGGFVHIQSEKDKGTRVLLKLPLTTAIIHALLIDVCNKTYAIPLAKVMEIISVSEGDIKTIQGAKVITLRGSILPLVMLQSLFGLVSSDNNGGHNAKFVVVVVERSGGRIGLVVDCALEQQEIVVKPPDEYMQDAAGLGGFTILGDGSIVPILDIASLTLA